MDAVFIVGIIFFTFYKMIELLVIHKERKLMINRSQMDSEFLQANFNSLHTVQCSKMQESQFSSLRWGTLAIGVGLGWITGWILDLQIRYLDTDFSYSSDSLMIATTAIFAGVALIIVYFIERKTYRAKKEE